MPTLKVQRGRTFTKVTVTLDGTSFIKCLFDSCDINYSGGLFDAVDCEWRSNRFFFRDAAWRTGAFIASMGWLKDRAPFTISYNDESEGKS
jgi:hypothetical protein